MSHALIIEDNMIVGRAIQSRLEALGFRSFDHSWTEEQAVEAASCRKPDLLVVGDTLEIGSRMSAARRISAHGSIPVLIVTADPFRVHQLRPDEMSFGRSFFLNEIEEAVRLIGVAA
ncbi:MAG: hypothetical protein PHE36_07615 [Novosphingobium sp.]|nr:hypothetical protein [Novosphingobium sp.]